MQFLKVCEIIATTAVPDRTLTIMYALGWTQHSVGSQMIRTAAMMQLLLGNIGMAGGGMNALRGHSNIQGLTDLGLLSNLLPGYLTLPGEKETDYQAYINKRALKPLRPNQMSYWQNYEKFHVSLMKAWFGDAATKKNNWCFDWLPKLDKVYDVLQTFEVMYQGKMNGYFCQGFNPLAAFPNKAKIGGALAKLKYLVVIDPLATETSCFWENHGELQRRRPREDPDRSLPPSLHLLRRGERVAHQLRPMAAMALEGRRSAGGSQARCRHHRRHLPQAA